MQDIDTIWNGSLCAGTIPVLWGGVFGLRIKELAGIFVGGEY